MKVPIERIAVYPGSFDPITLGHLDLIKRGLRLFDRLIIGVGKNSTKNPLFDLGLRVDLIRRTLKQAGLSSWSVLTFEDMLGDFAARERAKFILRGMRTMSDFEAEFQIAYANQALFRDLETVFVATDPRLTVVSSSVVREVLRRERLRGTSFTSKSYKRACEDFRVRMIGHLSSFVPETVLQYVQGCLLTDPHWFQSNRVK